MTPRFITLEGGEGAGKSTQAKWLAEALNHSGIACQTTREPGGSVGAEALRQLVVTGEAERWHPVTEALIFMTARYDHLETLIRPALAAGKWVVCDRFFDSTYVYQGIAKGIGGAWLQQLYTLLYGTIEPDVTLLLDIDPEKGLARAMARNGDETRFEGMDKTFHAALRAGFLARARECESRFAVIDAAHDAVTVHRHIIEALNQRFGLALAPVNATNGA
jgi:dTMP kinase